MYTVVVLAALGGTVDLPDFGRRRHGCCGGGGHSSCYGGGGYGGCYGGGGYGGCYGGGGYGGCYGGGGYGGRGGYAYGGYGSPSGYAYSDNTWYPGGNGYSGNAWYPSGQQYMSGYYGDMQPSWSNVNQGYNRPNMRPEDRRGDGVYSDDSGRRNDLNPDTRRTTTPRDGTTTPRDGTTTPRDGTTTPRDGSTTPRDGSTTPRDQNRPGSDRPMQEGAANQEMTATLVVSLPPEARLSIEGQPTRANSGERVFVSPPLQPGKTYSYNLKAELDRNGEKSTANQTVDVRAGQTSRVAVQFQPTDARK